MAKDDRDYERGKIHTFRLHDDELWAAVKAKAKLQDESVGQVIRRALRRYVDGEDD